MWEVLSAIALKELKKIILVQNIVSKIIGHRDRGDKNLEDLKVLKHSPDLLNNVKIG